MKMKPVRIELCINAGECFSRIVLHEDESISLSIGSQAGFYHDAQIMTQEDIDKIKKRRTDEADKFCRELQLAYDTMKKTSNLKCITDAVNS